MDVGQHLQDIFVSFLKVGRFFGEVSDLEFCEEAKKHHHLSQLLLDGFHLLDQVFLSLELFGSPKLVQTTPKGGASLLVPLDLLHPDILLLLYLPIQLKSLGNQRARLPLQPGLLPQLPDRQEGLALHMVHLQQVSKTNHHYRHHQDAYK